MKCLIDVKKRKNERNPPGNKVQSHTETKEDYSTYFHFLLTSCLQVVMTTSYPRAGAGLLPLEELGKSGRGGPQGPKPFYS